MVSQAGLLHKHTSYRISGQIFGLISSFLSGKQLRVVLDGKSSQKCLVKAGFPKGSILGPTFFLRYINDLLYDAICNIAVDADDTPPYSQCEQVSDLWQQLELAPELESDLQDTVDWGRKWLADFNAGKTQLVSFDWSSNIMLFMQKRWVCSLKKKQTLLPLFMDGVQMPQGKKKNNLLR